MTLSSKIISLDLNTFPVDFLSSLYLSHPKYPSNDTLTDLGYNLDKFSSEGTWAYAIMPNVIYLDVCYTTTL